MKIQAIIAIAVLAVYATRGEVEIPAFTSYLDPVDGPAKLSAQGKVIGWNNPAQKVSWFGEITKTGALNCAIKLRLSSGIESRLRLTFAGNSKMVTAKGIDSASLEVEFGEFDNVSPGYQRFTLESLNAAGKSAGDIESLVLGGPASEDAKFNLQPRRNAASVHLAYPTPDYTNIDAFYCEVTATEAPLWTYFEACGWHRGYFGMQVNSPTERRIIFSVWDSGDEPVDRGNVAAPDRVTLIAKGSDVYAGDFGNEGTGGHSHLVYNWKTGEKQRFLVTAKPVDAKATVYSGYWFHPEKKEWVLISSWKAPKDGKYLNGLYSFIEDFNGENGELRRKGLFGNQCFHTRDGKWHEETTAKFTCDETGNKERTDRFMGVEDGQFFLSTGGFSPGFTKNGTVFNRPATGQLPLDFKASQFSER